MKTEKKQGSLFDGVINSNITFSVLLVSSLLVFVLGYGYMNKQKTDLVNSAFDTDVTFEKVASPGNFDLYFVTEGDSNRNFLIKTDGLGKEILSKKDITNNEELLFLYQGE